MKKPITHALRSTLYLGICAATLLACTGKDGAPGPTGDQGTTGAPGTTGSKGNDVSDYFKDGSVTGKITGFRKDGSTPINEDFKYEYRYNYNEHWVSQITELNEEGIYEFSFLRFDSVFHSSSFQLRFEAPLDFSFISVKQVHFYYNKNLSATQVLGVEASASSYGNGVPDITFADIAYNPATGLLTGKYTWNAATTGGGAYSSATGSGLPLTVIGQFSIPCRQVSSFRLSAGK